MYITNSSFIRTLKKWEDKTTVIYNSKKTPFLADIKYVFPSYLLHFLQNLEIKDMVNYNNYYSFFLDSLSRLPPECNI